MNDKLNNKVANATKWSGITEIVAKLITPVTGMVLARLLTPEAFGVVTTITMVITFAELFTDAGFQKYLVQHEFEDTQELEYNTNVAFWSNFVLSLVIWGGISVFADTLSSLVGSPGLGLVLIIACVSIPLEAFSSIQMALFRRNLDFKKLFYIRLVSVFVPLVVTIPLAIVFRSYWALIIGTIAQNLSNAFLLTLYSKWKPKLYYSFKKLKEMLSFTIWSLVESISIWLTEYVDIFIVGTLLSQYYLGLYKTSTSVVSQLLGIITTATSPVLFSSLSRLQNNDLEFKQLFFKFQKIVGLLVMPLGIGIFCYSDFLTNVVLGEQWSEAAGFIGLWGLTSAFTIVLSHFASEIYRAKGLPKLSVLAQFLHIIVLFPVVLFFVKYGFEALYIARSLVRIELICVNLLILYVLVKISPWQLIRNIMPSMMAGLSMMIFAFFVRPISDAIIWQIITIVACALVYLGIIYLFPTERLLLYKFILKKQ